MGKMFYGHSEPAFPETAKAVLEGAVPPELQPSCPTGTNVWEHSACARDVLPGHGRAARHSHSIPTITAPPN